MRVGFETNFKLPFKELLRVINGSYTPKNSKQYFYHPGSKRVYTHYHMIKHGYTTWEMTKKEEGEQVFADFPDLDIEWKDDTGIKIDTDQQCIKTVAEANQDSTKCSKRAMEGGIYYITNIRPNQPVCIYCKNNCIKLFPGENWSDPKYNSVDCSCGDCNCEW